MTICKIHHSTLVLIATSTKVPGTNCQGIISYMYEEVSEHTTNNFIVATI